jgi:hypothetical protein
MIPPLSNPGVLLELIEEAGVGRPKQNKKAFILTCPRCEKSNKLYIRKRDGRFVCWYCKEKDNFQGAPEYAFAEITGKSIAELQKRLYGHEGTTGFVALDVTFNDYFDDEDLQEDMPVGALPHPDCVLYPDFRDLDSQWSAPGLEYLAGRGIPYDIAKEYGLMYWPARSRVVFPVKSQGRLLGWQSRTIKPESDLDEEGNIIQRVKALTYEGLAKDRVLMFADRVTGKHAVVTEGPVDGIKAHLCGGNVVTMGKAVSMYQLNLLITSGVEELYWGLDPDASEELASLIDKVTERNPDIRHFDMRPRDHRDLGKMSFEEVYDLKMTAPRVTRGNLFIYLKDFNDR